MSKDPEKSDAEDTLHAPPSEHKSVSQDSSASYEQEPDKIQAAPDTLEVPGVPEGTCLTPIVSHASGLDLGKKATGRSIATLDPAFEVDFDEGESPRSWSMLYKGFVIGIMSFSCTGM
jgi:hypothetical protein